MGWLGDQRGSGRLRDGRGHISEDEPGVGQRSFELLESVEGGMAIERVAGVLVLQIPLSPGAVPEDFGDDQTAQ